MASIPFRCLQALKNKPRVHKRSCVIPLNRIEILSNVAVNAVANAGVNCRSNLQEPLYKMLNNQSLLLCWVFGLHWFSCIAKQQGFVCGFSR